MKYVKMLGLAAVAAAALMAFVGASSASAAVLCKNNTTTGGCTEAYAKETVIESKLVAGKKAVLKTTFKNVECEESAVGGKTENAGGKGVAVEGKVTTLTFGKCNCEVKVLNEPGPYGSLAVNWVAASDNGTLTATGQEVTVTCSTLFGNVHCIYKTNATHLGKLTGGNPAKLNAEEAPVEKLTTNVLCSEQALWTAEYEVTAPKPLYVAEQ